MTRAMILAAGRGERLKPLTDVTPKPLIKIHDKPLIIYHIENLVAAGITEMIINISWLADKIQDYLGTGEKFGARIIYSCEPEALETGGGIFNALPYFQNQPFVLISADIYTDYPLKNLIAQCENFDLAKQNNPPLAHLILTPNPNFHPEGDFSLDQTTGLIAPKSAQNRYTYANLAVLHPGLFASCKPGKFPLGPLLQQAVAQKRVTGEVYAGLWHNVGTLSQLEKLQKTSKSWQNL